MNPLRSIVQGLVPVNIRQFLGHITGNREPLTENDLWPSDITAIQNAVKNSEEPGKIQYGEYKPVGAANKWGIPLNDIGVAETLKRSWNDPAYRMETLLGGASYHLDNNGNVVVTDNYNFNAKRKQVNALGPLDIASYFLHGITDANPLAFGNFLGNYFGATDDEQGNPVNINVGPLKNILQGLDAKAR